MSAYEKTSIQISRCKRILELVDTYVDCPTQDYRTALRKALMEEFEAPAIAPPVAAGSVDALIVWSYSPMMKVMVPDSPRAALRRQYYEKDAVIAWGAQQREAGRQEGMQTNENAYQAVIETVRVVAERAEKAEADLAESRKWHAKLERTVIEYDDKLKSAEARMVELQAALDVAMQVVALHAQ